MSLSGGGGGAPTSAPAASVYVCVHAYFGTTQKKLTRIPTLTWRRRGVLSVFMLLFFAFFLLFVLMFAGLIEHIDGGEGALSHDVCVSS